MRRGGVILLAAAACSQRPGLDKGSPAELAATLRPLAGADELTRRRAVAEWELDEPTWRRTVVEPYRALWRDYLANLPHAERVLADELAHTGAIAAWRHFAGDPKLTRAQGRLRWAVPVMYPSAVASLGDAMLDTVFVHDGTGWRALAGLDEVVLARVRARDPECARLVERAGPTGHCTEVAWLAVDGALRDDARRFAQGCALVATQCANSPP